MQQQQRFKNNLNQYKFKNKIVQIGCGSAPGNLVKDFYSTKASLG